MLRKLLMLTCVLGLGVSLLGAGNGCIVHEHDHHYWDHDDHGWHHHDDYR